MSEDKIREGIRQTVSTGIRLPFGCTLFLLDMIAVIYVLSHLSTVSGQVGRLIGLIP